MCYYYAPLPWRRTLGKLNYDGLCELLLKPLDKMGLCHFMICSIQAIFYILNIIGHFLPV